MKHYGFAVNYARLFVGHEWARDVVHSLFLAYYKKKGENIYDKEIPYIKTCIKNASRNFFRVYDKAYRNGYSTVGYEDDLGISSVEEIVDAGIKLDNLRKEVTCRHPRNAHKILKVLDLRLEGYNLIECKEQLGYNYNTVRDYWLNLTEYYDA